MWQVSRVAEFTPCLLQIVLNSVDLSVRQAGEWTCGHMSVPSVDMYARTYVCCSRARAHLIKITVRITRDIALLPYANKAMSLVFM